MNNQLRSLPDCEMIKAISDNQIKSTFRVMRQLRPNLDEGVYLEQIRRLQDEQGYNLLALTHQGEVKSVAGYRVNESLSWGRFMYVDDLITDEGSRKSGYARYLLDWLIAEARSMQCRQLHLDSGVLRYDAHRLYLTAKMRISCHHFEMDL